MPGESPRILPRRPRLSAGAGEYAVTRSGSSSSLRVNTRTRLWGGLGGGGRPEASLMPNRMLLTNAVDTS